VVVFVEFDEQGFVKEESGITYPRMGSLISAPNAATQESARFALHTALQTTHLAWKEMI
jgi:hypothetical protein